MTTIPAQASFTGPWGMKPPAGVTGAAYNAPGYTSTAGTVTTTANRCYYIPWPIYRPTTFTAAKAFNQGAGDNGEKFRIMFFYDAAGGPGALAKDFGEVTLTAASALRTLTSTWVVAPGNYWGAIWHDSASAMYGQTPFWTTSAVGAYAGPSVQNFIGELTSSFSGGSAAHCHYVDTAYGAAPATAVAPTASILGAFATLTSLLPDFKLVV